jgi:hypothetical protein
LHGHKVIPIGLRGGQIDGVEIITERKYISGVHTITLYVSAKYLADWTEYLFSLDSQRIIINPGTENPEFEQLARSRGIEIVRGCTLVMLSVGNY